MYLVIGWNASTKDDLNSQWYDGNGVARNWDYIRELVVASGETATELIASVNEYIRLCDMTMTEYLEELTSHTLPHLPPFSSSS